MRSITIGGMARIGIAIIGLVPHAHARPLSCGKFRFSDGTRCVDVRFRQRYGSTSNQVGKRAHGTSLTDLIAELAIGTGTVRNGRRPNWRYAKIMQAPC
jgi:hypothetical protein